MAESKLTCTELHENQDGMSKGVTEVAVSGFKEESKYDVRRLGYTDQAVDFIKDILFSSVEGPCKDNEFDIVELGCGTGKFTSSFISRVDRPVKYLATDPLGNMLRMVSAKCPGVLTKECAADNTGLPDASTKAVVAAQAFHWFANISSLREIHRILKPGGKLVLIWYTRLDTPLWVAELGRMLRPMYQQVGAPLHRSKSWQKVFDQFDGFDTLQSTTLPALSLQGTMEDILQYYYTLSVVAPSPENKNTVADFIRNRPELQNLETISIPYFTEIYWCSKQKT